MSQLDDFIARIHSEVLDRVSEADGTASTYKETAFTELVCELLADPIGSIDNPIVCFYEGQIGRGIGKVNGYCLSDDRDALDLFVTIFKNAHQPQTVTSEEVRKAVEQGLRYFDGAKSGIHTKMDPSVDSFEMTSRIYAAGGSIRRLRLFILTDGIATSKAKSPRFDAAGIDSQFEVWDVQRLARATAAGQPQGEINVDVVSLHGRPLSCIEVPKSSPDYQAYVTVLPGELIFRLFEDFGSQLLERNVRSFLQAKGKVNRGIRDTLSKTPEMFMAYNNGVSLTAESVEMIATETGSALTKIRGLQVVNGGQTTASIHRAGRSKNDLGAVHVLAKLTVIGPERLNDVAPLIAQFANTQNPIQMADFSANDPFHIELERLSQQIWIPGERGKWFYERARGQYQVAKATESSSDARARQFHERTPPSRRFAKTDLAKFLNSWNQLPHVVSLGGQKNFVLFMQHRAEAVAKDWRPDVKFYKDLISKAIIFNEATRLIRAEGFQSYKANIVTYLVALLSFRSAGQFDLDYVWSNQRLSTALESMLREWAHAVATVIRESAGTKNVTEWCKKKECWGVVRRTPVTLPNPMPPELQRVVIEGGRWGEPGTESRVELDPDELDAITTCRSTDADVWVRILEWASETGSLDAKQRELVGSFAATAAGGWQKDPPPRRAQEGRAILKLALDNGLAASL